jgi:hypothetical protein
LLLLLLRVARTHLLACFATAPLPDSEVALHVCKLSEVSEPDQEALVLCRFDDDDDGNI